MLLVYLNQVIKHYTKVILKNFIAFRGTTPYNSSCLFTESIIYNRYNRYFQDIMQIVFIQSTQYVCKNYS